MFRASAFFWELSRTCVVTTNALHLLAPYFVQNTETGLMLTLFSHHCEDTSTQVPATKDGNLNLCANTLITTHGGSTRCRHTSGSIQRTSPSTPTTARAPGLEAGQAQMRNSATVGCLANFMNSPSQLAQEANHRPCARPGMQESRSASLMFFSCGHAEFGVCQQSMAGPDLTLCARLQGREKREGASGSIAASRSGHERPTAARAGTLSLQDM